MLQIPAHRHKFHKLGPFECVYIINDKRTKERTELRAFWVLKKSTLWNKDGLRFVSKIAQPVLGFMMLVNVLNTGLFDWELFMNFF